MLSCREAVDNGLKSYSKWGATEGMCVLKHPFCLPSPWRYHLSLPHIPAKLNLRVLWLKPTRTDWIFSSNKGKTARMEGTYRGNDGKMRRRKGRENWAWTRDVLRENEEVLWYRCVCVYTCTDDMQHGTTKAMKSNCLILLKRHMSHGKT